ncbi:uncharacterized protein LOC123510732 [Portunus trituberculatus]|uniref:uncharacterized protein LOC123510732 n=1 Tax=Portunus trituberculatus TaxID=210409 RepID=UPI001E1CCE86|nr:uncharacterized protein LOC123510732 [Portunus trituberculatus]XP_045122009.1 uncharacterized protein LOC123510732 [Portunus trituberculatus]
MTEDECHGNEKEDVEELYTAIFHYVFPALVVTGILTNTLNLIVLTRPLMRGRTYRWLRALACVDLSLCVLTVPVCLARGGVAPLRSAEVARYYAHFGWSLSIASQILSFYLMGMFALERFLAVCRHDLYPRSQTDAVFRGGVVSSAVFVLLLYLPTMVVGRVEAAGEGRWMPRDGYSMQEYTWYRAYAWLREIFSRLVPAILITFCNVRITLRLKHLRNIREGFGSGVPAARRERERRLVLLLFWVTTLFYIFNTPVTVYYLGFLHTQRFCGKDMSASLLIFAAVSNLLQMLGNVSNFVLYFLISPEFHKTLCNLLACRDTGRPASLKLHSGNTTTTTMLPSTAAVITAIITTANQDQSLTRPDSACRHHLPGGAAPLNGANNFSGMEARQPSPGSPA